MELFEKLIKLASEEIKGSAPLEYKHIIKKELYLCGYCGCFIKGDKILKVEWGKYKMEYAGCPVCTYPIQLSIS